MRTASHTFAHADPGIPAKAREPRACQIYKTRPGQDRNDDIAAIYALKINANSVGPLYYPPPDSLQRQLDTSNGAYVTAVRTSSQAGFVKGDVITIVNDKIANYQGGPEMYFNYDEKNIFAIIRNG